MRRIPVFTQQEADARVAYAIRRERDRKTLIRPGQDEPTQHRTSEVLLSVPGVWEQFRAVPAAYYTLEGKTAVMVCPCGYIDPEIDERPQLRIDRGSLISCPGCNRFYWHGTQLYAANPDDSVPTLAHTHPYEQPCLPPCPEYQ